MSGLQALGEGDLCASPTGGALRVLFHRAHAFPARKRATRLQNKRSEWISWPPLKDTDHVNVLELEPGRDTTDYSMCRKWQPGRLVSGDGWLLDETAGRWFKLPFGAGRPYVLWHCNFPSLRPRLKHNRHGVLLRTYA